MYCLVRNKCTRTPYRCFIHCAMELKKANRRRKETKMERERKIEGNEMGKEFDITLFDGD